MKMTRILLMVAFLIMNVQAAGLKVNIINGTTSTLGTADMVNVLDLSQGMTPIASEQNVTGDVLFENVASMPGKQYLIQVFSNNISYSQMTVPPVDGSDWLVDVLIFDVSDEATDLVVNVPFFTIQAVDDRLYIQKRLTVLNESNPPMTFRGDPGIIKVHIPQDVLQMDYVTFQSGTMPLQTQPVESENSQVITNAIKPGTSQIDIAYYLQYSNSDVNFSELVHYDSEHFHVYASPTSLHVHGDGLERDPSHDQDGWAAYIADGVEAGTMLNFHISGAGFSEQQTQQSTGRIVIEHRMPQGTKIVLSVVLILAMIVALAYSLRKEDEAMKQDSIDQLKSQKKKLLKEYGRLRKNAEDKATLEQVQHQLYSVYKTLDRIG